jgi:hypothetical protein
MLTRAKARLELNKVQTKKSIQKKTVIGTIVEGKSA